MGGAGHAEVVVSCRVSPHRLQHSRGPVVASLSGDELPLRINFIRSFEERNGTLTAR